MNREVHVWICEGLGVKFPQATRLSFYEAALVVVISFFNKGKSVSQSLPFSFYDICNTKPII